MTELNLKTNFSVYASITGTIKWFNDEKGYGMITPDGTTDDLFVHFKAIDIDGFKCLKEGQTVPFVRERGQKGDQASQVQNA
ncbi:hypothetical protein ACHAP5_005158 [Fusarium lateritium]